MSSTPLSFYIFLQLQLERIRGKPQAHAPGPKKPTLTQKDLERRK